MAVRAKFYVAEITQYATGTTRPGFADPAPIGKVVLRPVTRGADNKDWASSTPSGMFEMTVHGSAYPWFADRLAGELSILIEDAPTTE